MCAAEKLLPVKILFEEVSSKASFERREERSVTESERKRIPDLRGRDAKGTTPKLFSFSPSPLACGVDRRLQSQQPGCS